MEIGFTVAGCFMAYSSSAKQFTHQWIRKYLAYCK